MDEPRDAVMGLWMTTALVVGTIVGAGIFMLPVSLAPLGANVPIAWAISGAGVVCIAASLARLSTLGGEGIQANVERQFGATAGFLVAWSFWVSNWTAQASVALGIGSALAFLSPDRLGGSVMPMAVSSLLLVTALNAVGARASGRFGIVTVAIKLLPLFAVLWLLAERGLSGAAFEPLPPTPVTLANLAAATALTFFALTGFEMATTPVGKVRDPARTIPRALIGGTLFVVLLYAFAGSGLQRLLPAETVAASPAPFADVLIREWGDVAAGFAAAAIAVAAIGCLNGLVLGTGELGLSMGRRGDLPATMARTRGRETPVVAQVAGTALSIGLLLANSGEETAALFTFAILLSTSAVGVVYAVGSAAAWRLSSTGGKSLILLAFAFLAFALAGIGWSANLWVLALLGIGLAIRTLMHRSMSEAARAGAPRVPAA